MADKKTYYFSTYDFELAYNVLDIQVNQVYKTDEKGVYHLLKSIIDNPDDYIEYFDEGHLINIKIDTDLKKVVEETVHGAIYTPKKIYNRGNHDNANYPNASFREHNAMKRLAAAQYKVSKDIQNKLPRAIELIKEEERRAKQSNVRASISNKNYGGFLTQSQMQRGDFEPTRGKEIKHKKGPYEI